MTPLVGEEHRIDEALNAGAVDFMMKPALNTDLAFRIKKWVSDCL